uniref:Gamma-interferon-inducible lysosomal thiol reductase n=1 Tax=Acrobeloides nanus TaxID=290746 RepID=A0A914CN99_9BILA
MLNILALFSIFLTIHGYFNPVNQRKNLFTDVNCARIPPSFWCSNDQLTKTCGFAEVCNRYSQASKNQKVKLTVLYESMCPDCQKFITDILYRDVYLKFGDFVEIELVPYGNAKNKNGTVTCQHGEEECRINKYESCALHYINEPVPFIYCLENQLRMGSTLDQGAPKCYETLHIQPHISDQVIHCANGKYGDKMQQEDAKKTDNIWPDKHEYVPWLVFNGVSLKNAQFFIKNLPSAICEWYVGDRPPSACRGIGNTRRKNLNSVCMND